MKSSKIKVLNTNVKAGDTNLIKVRDYNNIIEDLEFLYPEYNAPFSGTINLNKLNRLYAKYTVDAALDVKLGTDLKTGSNAIISFIADGATTPTFTAFTQINNSEAYDTTLAAVNIVSFFWDGTTAYYTITLEK